MDYLFKYSKLALSYAASHVSNKQLSVENTYTRQKMKVFVDTEQSNWSRCTSTSLTEASVWSVFSGEIKPHEPFDSKVISIKYFVLTGALCR